MSCPIVDTPTETKLGIIEALQAIGTSKDLVNLSCTCHPFREILIPEIFKSIVLHNDEKSNGSLEEVEDRGYTHHVKELHYQGKHAVPDYEYEEDASDDVLDDETGKNLLPPHVDSILSDLSCFPKLEKLIVEFPFGKGQGDPEDECDGDTSWEWAASFYNFEVEEDAEDVKKYEQRYGWRALMAKSFDAIVRNKKSTIRSLELRETVSKEVSTWSTQNFRDFLEPMEEFKISIRGNDNGAGWHINTLGSYHSFLTNLHVFFFDHLPNVTSLSLSASGYGPIGLEGARHSPFCLTPGSMPLLKSINLEYCFIDPPLVDFLSQHSETLESITFNHCMGSIQGLANNGIYWHTLFTSLTKANLQKLKRFEVLPVKVSGVGDLDDNQYGNLELFERAAEIWEAEEDQGRRAFPYAMLNSKYGTLFEDEETNVEAFLEERDQKGFDELMTIVERNVAEAET